MPFQILRRGSLTGFEGPWLLKDQKPLRYIMRAYEHNWCNPSLTGKLKLFSLPVGHGSSSYVCLLLWNGQVMLGRWRNVRYVIYFSPPICVIFILVDVVLILSSVCRWSHHFWINKRIYLLTRPIDWHHWPGTP